MIPLVQLFHLNNLLFEYVFETDECVIITQHVYLMHGILLLYVTATWNFHESSHGKGIPDGVGATIKRLADSAVLHGTDVENATDLMAAITTSIQMYHVTAEEITAAAIELMKLNIPSLPKTMATHQLITTSPNVVHH